MVLDDVKILSRKLSRKFDLEVIFGNFYPSYLGKFYPFFNKIEFDVGLIHNPTLLCHVLFHEATHSTSIREEFFRDLPLFNKNYNENLEEYIAEFTAFLLSKKFKNKLSKSDRTKRIQEFKKFKSNLSKTQINYAKKEIFKIYNELLLVFET